MAIGTVELNLSLKDPATGLPLTACVYTVEGVNNADNTPRLLSIGQLVMAICLKRATALEAKIVAMMEDLNRVSAQLEAMTEIESWVIDFQENGNPSGEASWWIALDSFTISSSNAAYAGQNARRFLSSDELGVIASGVNYVISDTYITANGYTVRPQYDIAAADLVTALEAKMDAKNSFSQQTMIELQSLTSKRDQTYDMISNILKSLNTVLVGNANNI